jgi:hypothetical protein
MTTLVGFIIWIVFGVAVGIRATHRGRNAWGWLFISILISPLLAAILLFLLPVYDSRTKRVTRSEMAARIAVLDPSVKVNSGWDSHAMAAKIVELEAANKAHRGWKSLRA